MKLYSNLVIAVTFGRLLFFQSDPMAVVYTKGRDGTLQEIGRTEVVLNSLNPKWITKHVVTYHFEVVQTLVYVSMLPSLLFTKSIPMFRVSCNLRNYLLSQVPCLRCRHSVSQSRCKGKRLLELFTMDTGVCNFWMYFCPEYIILCVSLGSKYNCLFSPIWETVTPMAT